MMTEEKQSKSYQTRQKKAVRDVLHQANTPLTPQQILYRASETCPRIGMATVYRCLRNLMREGVVRIVEIPGAPPHYEIERNVHHHFFLCEMCNHIFNLDGCAQGLEQLVPEGFVLHRHEITLYGLCPTCKEKRAQLAANQGNGNGFSVLNPGEGSINAPSPNPADQDAPPIGCI